MIDQDDEKAGPVDGERAADFAQLQRMAAEGDQGAPGAAGEAQQGEAGVPLAQEISAVLSLLVKLATPIFPSLEEIYSEQVIGAVGAAVEPVCIKHGWLADGIGGKYAEELAAACVLGPLAWATVTGIKRDIASRKKPEAIGQGPANLSAPIPDTAPGQKTVQFGGAVAE
ncbi:hypothetical protein [Lacisediminimonas profundi]|uniref:hypothetical protein n=1 Tax=Lacisediminimonas profundi TaxID=2603856 RepID=UPI00124B9FE7|nr:hypothetical protein [Lacisediminimonas profundi]